MGNNIDNFILEVEARLKNDGAKLTNELKSLIKKIENEPLEININHKKLDYGIADVKKRLQELNADLNEINLDSAYKSFIKLSQILKQSATYSKEISDAMSKLSKLKVDFGKLDDLNAHQKKKTPLSSYEKMNAGDIKKAAKNQTAIIKQMQKELNNLKVPNDLQKDITNFLKKIEEPLSNLKINLKNGDEVKAFIKSINDEGTELFEKLNNVQLTKLQNDAESIVTKMNKVQKEINTIEKSMSNGILGKDNSQDLLNTRIKCIEELRVVMSKLEGDLKGVNSQIKQFDNDKIVSYSHDSGEKFKVSEANAKRNAKLKENYKSLSSGIEINDKFAGKDGNYYNQILMERNKLLFQYENIMISISKNPYDYNVDELQECINKLKEVNKLLNDKDYKYAIDILDENINLKDNDADIKDILKSKFKDKDVLEDSFKFEYDGDILRLSADCKDADGNMSKLIYSFNDVNKAITSNSKVINKHEKSVTSFTDKVRKKFTDIGAYFLSYVSIQEFISVMRQGFDIIVEMDNQLSEMQKVSDESLSSLKAYASESFKIASQIGSTGLELQSSTADYMRLGKSLQEASSLAKDTNILMNVSEFSSIDEATESLISMTQAYQELGSMDIIDKLNLAGNNYSISTSDLAQSLQKSSSALKTAKNDFDEAIALTVAGNSVVQDPDSVAAGIRTISLRMTGTEEAKSELESLGENVDNVLTKSKLNETLEKLTSIDGKGGISLLDDNGNYRSTAQVLIDLADRWEAIGKQDLSDGENRQNALLEALAGKNRSNILASILNDPDLLKNVYEDVSTNYDGSAMKENEKYLESIQGHLDKLKNTWQEFWASDNNREFINDILDLANAFLELINSIGGAKAALIILTTAFTGFKWATPQKILLELVKNFEKLSKIKDIPMLTKFKEVLSGSIAKNAGEGASASAIASAPAMAINPYIAGALAVASVSLIAYNKYIDNLEESAERAEKAADNYKKVFEDLNKFKADIPNLAEEYDNLREGISSAGENLSLTNDEFSRYNEITNQIASKFPSLISGYTSTGNAIVNMKNSIEELNKAYDVQLQKEAYKSIREASLSDQDNAIKLEHDKTKKLMTFYGELNSSSKGYAYKNLSHILNTSIENSQMGQNVKDSISEYIKKIYDTGNLDFKDGSYKNLNDIYKSFAFDSESYDTFRTNLENMVNANDKYSEMAQIVLNEFDSRITDFANEYEEKLSMMVTYAQSKAKYYNLDDLQRSNFDSMVKNFNESDYNTYSTEEGMTNLLNKFVKYSKTDPSTITSLNDINSIYGQSTSLVKANETIDGLAAKLSKGIGVSSETIRKQYNLDEYKTNYDSITTDIVSIINDISKEIDKSTTDWKKEKISQFEKQKTDIYDEMINNDITLQGTSVGVTNGTKYGNIDLNNRKALAWNKNNINKYKNVLKSWGESSPDDLLGGISTVQGGWGTYDGIDIAFSPMLQTKDGVEFLDADTVDNYINSLISEASKDGSWTNEELLQLDAKGLSDFKVNGNQVKGLIADIGSTAEKTAETMHYIGKDGAIDIIDQEIQTVENSLNSFEDISKELLSENFSPSELEKINNVLDSKQTLLIDTWQNGLYKYYDNWKDYILDFTDIIGSMSSSYHGENKSFSQLSEDNSSYSSTLSQLNNLGNNNVKITDEMAEALKSYGDEFDKFIKLDGNDYVITNTQAVKEQIEALEERNSIDAKNSKETARREYTEITNSLVNMTDQLYLTAEAEGYLDESILNNIDSSKEQLRAIQKNIQRYAQLEQQLLGTSNAFDVYNSAVEYDASNDSYSKTSQMMDTLKSAFETGKYGEASFDAALQGILSDDKYESLMNIKDVKTRIETAKKLYKDAKQYMETDDDGNSKFSSLEKFITSAQNKGLFTGKGLEGFRVKEGISLNSFAEQMGYSKEYTYSILEEIQKYNAEGDNIFDGFRSSTFDKNSDELEKKNQEIIDLNNKRTKSIIALSKITNKESEEYKNVTDEINKYTAAIYEAQGEQAELNNQNVKNVQGFLDKEKQIENTTTQLELYEKRLAELKANPEGNETEIAEIELNIDNARNKLGELLQEKEKLGEPVEIQLKEAKEDIQKKISEKEKEKRDIVSKATGSDATLMSDSQLTKQLKLLPTVDQENIKKIDEDILKLQENIQSINIKLGINTGEDGSEDASEYETTVEKIKADKKKLGKDVSFEVKAKNCDKAYKNLNKVTKEADKLKVILNKLENASVNVTTTFTSNGSSALGNANTKTKNALVKSENTKKSIKEDFQNRLNKSITSPLYLHQVLGNAFSIGSNNSKYKSGKTLVGEFGAETIVDPYSGRYYVVGQNGAELVNIPKDAIVFNHRQTEQLNRNNKINSRGKLTSDASVMMRSFSHALGTYGDARVTLEKTKTNPNNSNSSNSKSSKNSSNNDTKSLVDDLFDWIEIRLERLANKTQKWITLAENAISKSVQKSHYTSAINSTATQLSQNQTAKDKYLAQANALIRKSGVKNASAYAKKVRDGSLSIQSISNEKLKDFLTSYKEMYDKAVDCSNAVMDLTGELQDLAETLYNIPIEHAEKKVEKYSDKMDVLSAKYETYRGYGTQNANLDEQTKLQNSIKNAYASAYTETKSNLKSAKSKINSTSDKALKGLTSAQKKKIVANVQAGKEVNISNSYSASLKKALANYNAALEANRVAYNESAKASAEATKVLRENTNAKYENITAFYEQNRSLNQAKISKLDAKLDYRNAVGYSAVSSDQKKIYEEQIKYDRNILNHLQSERNNYDENKIKKQYESGKLSREDYFSLLSHIRELDEEIYNTKVTVEETKKEIFNLNITRLDYIIDGIARAMERFKNIISLKEARDEDIDESYYVSQNESLMAQIERIHEKRLDYIERMKDYDPESKEYQDLATKLAEADNEAMAKFIELEENKDEMVHNRLKKVDDAIDKLNTVGDDIEHLRDLLSDDELIDNNGVFTDSGLAEIALVGELIDNNNQKIKDYKYGLEKLEENFKNGNLSPEEYEEKSREFIKGIQDSVKAIDGYNDSLVDLYSKQLEIENDALKEVIDNRKKALQSKKSYYDYDKTLKSANKDIVSLKNQIAALEGVGNAAAKAEVERLKSQLSEAETELADTKYEHTVELQLSGYEEMSASADKILEDLLDDLKTNAQLQEEVVSNMLDNVVKNYETAYAKIQKTINSTEISNNSLNSISKDGNTFSTSVNESYNDRKNTSYGNIETSTINIGNQNTADIESSISGYQPSSNTTVNSINASTDNVKVTVGGNPATVTCDPRPVTATDRTISAKASSSKVSVKVKGLKVIITGKSAGNCEVKITANDSGGKSQTISVTVEAAATPTPNSGSGGGKKDAVPAVDKKTETPKAKEKKSTAGYISSLSPVITSSSSSAYIKKVQTALNGLGIKGKDGKKLTVDGKWGTNTDYAVKTFQKSSKWGGSITADGKIGAKTKLKFKKAGYYKGGIVDNVITNTDFLNMIRMNNDDGLITAKLGEGIIPKNLMPNFASQIEKFNSLPADKIINSISNNAPNLNIQIDKFMDVQGNVDKNCVNDIRNLQNDITNNITKTLTQEFRKLGYK